jgi:hypothetical protein
MQHKNKTTRCSVTTTNNDYYSRELRFLDGCPWQRIISFSGKSVLWANFPESEKEVSTIWARVESREKGFRLRADAISRKGTMSVVEEMITMTYFRVLEENHGLILPVLSPLLDTIHTDIFIYCNLLQVNHHHLVSVLYDVLLQQKEQQYALLVHITSCST